MSRPAVLVTGGADRSGRRSSAVFAAEGWHVVIHCNHSRAEADALAAGLPSAEVAIPSATWWTARPRSR